MRDASARLLWRFAVVGMLALCLAIVSGEARAMTMIDSSPKVDEIVEGKGVSFAIRFDQPVSHRSSRLILVSSQGNRTLALRLNTEPDTLYSYAGVLQPGKYELRWEAHATDGTVVKGSIPFTVRAK